MKLISSSLYLMLIIFTPVHAWGLRETEAEKAMRFEKMRAEQKISEQKFRAVGYVKTNFRLESSYSALKETRKALACFALVYPALIALLYNVDKELAKPYVRWIPHALFAVFAAWGVENILRGQVELNREQYEQIVDLNK